MKLSRSVFGVALLSLLLSTTAASAQSSDRNAPPRRDEFGRIPEDASDKDLVLPDRVLDRNWPGMEPGRSRVAPPAVASDEEQIDPFREKEDLPQPTPGELQRRAEERAEEAGTPKTPPPARPPVGPDGRYDMGSPIAEVDPAFPDMLEMDKEELSEIEIEENFPSPLDVDDGAFDMEAGDPGEW